MSRRVGTKQGTDAKKANESIALTAELRARSLRNILHRKDLFQNSHFDEYSREEASDSFGGTAGSDRNGGCRHALAGQ